MNIRSAAVITLIFSLCLEIPLWAVEVPADWGMNDKPSITQFIELLKTKEKYQRDKNLPAYLNLLPKFLAATLKNQAKTLQLDDKKLSDSLASHALTESAAAKLEPIGFKRKDVTAALVVREAEDASGQIPYRIQSYYLEDTQWKVGESVVFSKKGNEGIGAELGRVVFHKTLPSVPTTIQKGELTGMYDIESVEQGVKIEWSVNGNAQSSMEARTPSSSSSGVIMGGLKKGINTIQLRVSGASSFSTPITVKIRPETKNIEDYQRKIPYIQWDIPAGGKYTKEFSVKEK